MAQILRDLWATPGSCLILIIPTFLCMIQQSPLLAQLNLILISVTQVQMICSHLQ